MNTSLLTITESYLFRCRNVLLRLKSIEAHITLVNSTFGQRKFPKRSSQNFERLGHQKAKMLEVK
jgi:hypothetical protein